MGLMSGGISVTELRVLGEMPKNLPEFVLSGLRSHGFVSIDETADERSAGWVQLGESQNSRFADRGDIEYDEYLCFALRLDQRKVPSSVARAHQQMAERDWLSKHPGVQRVPKAAREEIKEQVMHKLLRRTLPIPSVVEMAWDTRRGVLLLASLSPKTVDLVSDLFRKSFEGLSLVMVTPYARACALSAGRPWAAALEAANQAGSTAVLDDLRGNCWLGQEMLLWLMQGTLGGGESQVRADGPEGMGTAFYAFLNDRMALAGATEAGTQKVTVAGPQVRYEEVRTAIAGGKVLTDALLHLQCGEWDWRTGLSAATLAISSAKLPTVKLEKDEVADAVSERIGFVLARLGLVASLRQLLDSLLLEFLELRFSKQWSGFYREATQGDR